MAKRRRNVRSALERNIEKAGEVESSAAAVVSAVAAYAKMNASGQWSTADPESQLGTMLTVSDRAGS